MTDKALINKEKLVKLIQQAEEYGFDFIEKNLDFALSDVWCLMADHLIANGVVPVIRCKDCKYSNFFSSNERRYCMRQVLKDDYSTGKQYVCSVNAPVKDSAFCSYAEPKARDEE